MLSRLRSRVATARGMVGASVGWRSVTTLPPGALALDANPLTSRNTSFTDRHVGPRSHEIGGMLEVAGGFGSLDEFVDSVVPETIRQRSPLEIPAPLSERDALRELRGISKQNVVSRSLLGMGYYGTHTPTVIQRNMLEDPSWYTSYTPYQAEISQGRLEMLLNFQTMVTDLTGMDIANASLLDEATAAGEAMYLCFNLLNGRRRKFFVSDSVHPQTLGVLQTRARGIGVEIEVGNVFEALEKGQFVEDDALCGVLAQFPDTHGIAYGMEDVAEAVHEGGAQFVVASDLLALTLLTPPGEWGADIVLGSAQRFGVPMGYGGPHAAFFAVRDGLKRRMPGRVIGVTRDAAGGQALRMAMQTREQHIRRDKATSNICTAQALLANMAAAFAVYHGPMGLKEMAGRIRAQVGVLAHCLREAGHAVDLPGDLSETSERPFEVFDTILVDVRSAGMLPETVALACKARGLNIRIVDDSRVAMSLDQTTTIDDLETVAVSFTADPSLVQDASAAHEAGVATTVGRGIPSLARSSPFLDHPVFNSFHSETQMLRYLKQLASKDISLANSMIPLGSCTMKLNATTQMVPVTWPEFTDLHPFAPREQAQGYHEMLAQLGAWLSTVSGFDAVSLQPNSGANGEYAGLMTIRAYHKASGQEHRNICLIPTSAHGTNPASAVVAGMVVKPVKSDAEGNVDIEDLDRQIEACGDNLGAIMITYPSTFGVFEEGVRDVIDKVHAAGGQVYMDGANMNAQVGLTSPGHIGADVCHLNLHKTMSIPHGGGGPGMGPIGVREHLAPYLPKHSVLPTGGFGKGIVDGWDGAVSAAAYGSPLILAISWMYIRLLGERGLRHATEMALLNANYMRARLEEHYSILYHGARGQCAHEFIVDLRPFKAAGIQEKDVAKRLIDYGFHAPTMSWPVPGTLMIEPTESEDKAELDRFCEAMISIRAEIQDVVEGRVAADDSPLKHAPHTIKDVTGDHWDRKYSRDTAAFPAPWLKEKKFWPPVGRVDDVYGDRHLICSCPPMEDFVEED